MNDLSTFSTGKGSASDTSKECCVIDIRIEGQGEAAGAAVSLPIAGGPTLASVLWSRSQREGGTQ